jgi:large subunit ribosomal protein L29
MKATKARAFREQTDEQLRLALREVEKNLFHLRFQSATERLETPSEITKAKREVARIKTVMRERERERERAQAGAAAGAATTPAAAPAPTAGGK